MRATYVFLVQGYEGVVLLVDIKVLHQPVAEEVIKAPNSRLKLRHQHVKRFTSASSPYLALCCSRDTQRLHDNVMPHLGATSEVLLMLRQGTLHHCRQKRFREEFRGAWTGKVTS